MTAAVEAPLAADRDRLGVWCGWVMVGAAVLIPLLAWLSPLGFAPLLALIGLLCLPALRLGEGDRPVLMVLTGALAWAAISTLWSPWRPESFEGDGVVQLGLALPLYWSAICGARRADRRLAGLALRILAWGLALVGVELIADSFADGRIYQRLHEAVEGPLRPDLARWNMARASFILALLWPAVLVGGLRRRGDLALLGVTVAGQVIAGHVTGADAPVVALPLAAAAMLVVWRRPAGGPRLMAAAAAAFTLLMPVLVWALRVAGGYAKVESELTMTWAARMSYWSHAVDWIAERPLRGWGLDASRAMGPGIQLHPHNEALQMWLELGLPGAVAAAAFWGLSLLRLARERRDLAMAGVAGSCAVYLLFAWVSYGAWQGWWLALGALIAVLSALLTNGAASPKST